MGLTSGHHAFTQCDQTSAGTRTLAQRILACADQITPSEKKLVDIMLEADENIALHTAVELAKMAAVSDATVSRLAIKLGYSGYPEMQQDAKQSLRKRLNDVTVQRLERSLSVEGSLAEASRRIENMDLRSVEGMSDRVYPVLENLVEVLTKARSVFCIGVRSSAPPAQYLAFALNFMRSGVTSLAGRVDSDFDKLLDMDSRDLVIAFATARYARYATELITLAARQGASLFLVTDSPECPSAKYTNQVFVIQSEYVGVVPSLVPFFALVHMIIGAASKRFDSKKVCRRLRLLEQIYESTTAIAAGTGVNPADDSEDL